MSFPGFQERRGPGRSPGRRRHSFLSRLPGVSVTRRACHGRRSRRSRLRGRSAPGPRRERSGKAWTLAGGRLRPALKLYRNSSRTSTRQVCLTPVMLYVVASVDA